VPKYLHLSFSLPPSTPACSHLPSLPLLYYLYPVLLLPLFLSLPLVSPPQRERFETSKQHPLLHGHCSLCSRNGFYSFSSCSLTVSTAQIARRSLQQGLSPARCFVETLPAQGHIKGTLSAHHTHAHTKKKGL